MKNIYKFLSFLICIIIMLSGCSSIKNITASPSTTSATTDEPLKTYYTYADITNRLTDLTLLAGKASSGEVSMEKTTYDRSSVYNEKTDKYINWGANLDGEGYEYTSGGGKVICDIKGAGYINRIWAGEFCKDGQLRITIDDKEPFVLRFKDVGTSKSIFPYGELCYVTNATGYNSYVPITFNESCKIMSYGKAPYIHIGYTLLSEGTTVEPFVYPLTETESTVLAEANDKLSNKITSFEGGTEYILNPGESVQVYQNNSSGALTVIRAKVSSSDEKEAKYAVRDLSIAANWDGQADSAFSLSLGDFFASPVGLSSNACYPCGTTDDGVMYSNWYMPFLSASITVTNNGNTKHTFTIAFTDTEINADKAEKLLRFAGLWVEANDCDESSPLFPETEYVTLMGNGRLVGLTMHNYQIGSGIWWGEGDEKFYIDGEKFPSWFGTGSEDYFGFSSANPTLFANAYHSQAVNDNRAGVIGNKVLSRYHISDAIHFNKSLKLAFEKYYNNEYVYFSACILYYIEADNTDNFTKSYNETERNNHFYIEKAPVPVRTHYEADILLDYVETTSGKVFVQGMGDGWSEGLQFLWKNNAANGELTFPVSMAEEGDYNITGVLTLAVDFGQFEFYIDGEFMCTADLWKSGQTKVTDTINMRKHHLTAGEHLINIKCIGKNEQSYGYFFAMDYFDFNLIKD